MILRREEPQGAFDRLSLGVATVAVVRALAMTRPVLIAVDDVQWLDPPTARLLVFVARRLAGSATRLAVASRTRRGGRLARRDRPGDARRLVRHDPSRSRSARANSHGSCAGRSAGRRCGRACCASPSFRAATHCTRSSSPARSGPHAPDEDLGSLPATVVELARARIAKLPQRVREASGTRLHPSRSHAGPARPARRRRPGPAWHAGCRAAQRDRHLRRGADPLLPPDPRRRRVRFDPHRSPPRAAPRGRDALRRPGGTRSPPRRWRRPARTRRWRSCWPAPPSGHGGAAHPTPPPT